MFYVLEKGILYISILLALQLGQNHFLFMIQIIPKTIILLGNSMFLQNLNAFHYPHHATQLRRKASEVIQLLQFCMYLRLFSKIEDHHYIESSIETARKTYCNTIRTRQYIEYQDHTQYLCWIFVQNHILQ